MQKVTFLLGMKMCKVQKSHTKHMSGREWGFVNIDLNSIFLRR
jgi:hypothetical protein